jgi:hypothetical protein
MKELLVTYFISNGRVTLPNIGSIQLVIESANITNSAIEPPKYTIHFTADSNNVSQNQLQFLSSELDKSIDQISSELNDLSNEIKSTGVFVLGNFGILKYINEVFVFESIFSDADYQSPVEINLTDTQININNNNWIWWALGLTTIALLAIYLK